MYIYVYKTAMYSMDSYAIQLVQCTTDALVYWSHHRKIVLCKASSWTPWSSWVPCNSAYSVIRTAFDSTLDNHLLCLASLVSYFLPHLRSSWPLKCFFSFLFSYLFWRFYSDQTKIPFLIHVLALHQVTMHHIPLPPRIHSRKCAVSTNIMNKFQTCATPIWKRTVFSL